MKVYIDVNSSGNTIATIATGGDFLERWEKNALSGWEKYCRRHGLGLIVFDEELAPKNSPVWKKAHWQKMLMGNVLKKESPRVKNVCYLDTDIIINHTAPNIFDKYEPEQISLVSLRRNLPFPYEEVLKRMAFLRHHFYDSNYPLDSALFMSLEQLYSYHGMPVQQDEACTGLIVFNVENHADLMEGWFHKYDSDIQSITNGGEQTHLNYEIQSYGRVSFLDYRFQAIWPFEMAWKYPFLYGKMKENEDLIRECIEASLYQNYFLHFAGSWHESRMWKIGGFFEAKDSLNNLEGYKKYLDTPVFGLPVGQIKPR
jgi:hypothetical protein